MSRAMLVLSLFAEVPAAHSRESGGAAPGGGGQASAEHRHVAVTERPGPDCHAAWQGDTTTQSPAQLHADVAVFRTCIETSMHRLTKFGPMIRLRLQFPLLKGQVRTCKLHQMNAAYCSMQFCCAGRQRCRHLCRCHQGTRRPKSAGAVRQGARGSTVRAAAAAQRAAAG